LTANSHGRPTVPLRKQLLKATISIVLLLGVVGLAGSRAVAAVSVRSLAGALFFQIAGQLMARGVIAGREGIWFSAIVVIGL